MEERELSALSINGTAPVILSLAFHFEPTEPTDQLYERWNLSLALMVKESTKK